ncbi:MAG: SocA family protein [Spirochaetales bacterium]|nr:SocA family protein [Spirochaetales bacterium]
MNNFNEEKAIQVLSYIQRKTSFQDYIPLLKLVYFSERYSLRKYCITILDDVFYAMKNGPVASNTYNILKGAYNFRNKALDQIVIPTGEYSTLISYEGNYNRLSLSDIESLDFSIKKFSGYNNTSMIGISHMYPEWYKHEKEITPENPRAFMPYLDFFDDPDEENLEKLKRKIRANDPYKNEKIEISRSIYMGA